MTKHTRPCQQGVLCIKNTSGRVQPYRFRGYLVREVCSGALLCPGLKDAVAELAKGLPLEDRRTRFFACVTQERASEMEEEDYKKASLSLGAFNQAGELVAIAHLIDCGKRQGELSFITASLHRRHGLSRELAQRLLKVAWRLGILEVHLYVLVENQPMVGVMRQVEGAQIKKAEGDETLYEIIFARPPGHAPTYELLCGICGAAVEFALACAKAPINVALTRLAA